MHDYITPVLSSMLECLRTTFGGSDRPGFCRLSLVAGEAAWDDCCECDNGGGQAWVRLAGMAPDPASPPDNDRLVLWPMVLTIGVGVLRCVPRVDANGVAPSAAEETAAAIATHLDAVISRYAIDCCWAEATSEDWAYRWAGWTPLGYEGGCGGGEHIYEVVIPACECPEESLT